MNENMAGNIQQAKSVLRKQIKSQLRKMPQDEVHRQSQIIVKKLIEMPEYQKSRRISVYLSMAKEVQTESILKDAFGSNKTIFIPKYVGKDMAMVKLGSMDDYRQLPETSWKIKQPLDDDHSREDALSGGGLDLIVVPGVGFTQAGHRMGHGGGYYDTYLEKVFQKQNSYPFLVGLGFDFQMQTELPLCDWDKMLDAVITV